MTPTDSPMTDDPEFDTRVEDGRTVAETDQLQPWDDNPREAEDTDIERLTEMLETLGQFKPLLVEPDGTVIGGNMRIEAMDRLDWDSAWVSIVDPEDQDERIEYALADNDRVGHYTEDAVSDLISGRDIDITRYKPDFYEPTDMAQNLARGMDPEEILELTGEATEDEDGEDGTDGDGGEDGSSTSRSLENIASESTTEMVQLFMTGDTKRQMMSQVDDLKDAYGMDTTTDVVQEAIAREHSEHVQEDADEQLIEAADE